MAKTAVKMQESKSVSLTDRQERFCEEYLVDLNATQAAIRAGYSRKTANQQGSRLLVNVGIQTEIQQKKSCYRSNLAVANIPPRITTENFGCTPKEASCLTTPRTGVIIIMKESEPDGPRSGKDRGCGKVVES